MRTFTGMPPSTRHPNARSARDVPGGKRIEITLDTTPERVPATVLVPEHDASAPASLLLHGFTSRRERMVDSVGRALLEHGIGSLAIDLPLHGSREGRIDELSLRSPLQVVRTWRMALAESRTAIRFMSEYAGFDAERLALVGYSLGSFLGTLVAAEEPSVRAVVLAAGGDLPDRTPFGSLVRTIADPLRAVRKLRGIPLLMVNGRWDRTVTAPQAERLYAAAGEPKELRWYDGGHWPPMQAIAGAAEWVAEQMAALSGRRA